MIQHIKNITILFFLLLSLSVSACSKDDFTPAYPKSEGVTRLVSYNVGVFAKYAKSGYKMTARMMKELDADAVCMQELDSCTTRTKHVFQVKRFVKALTSFQESRTTVHCACSFQDFIKLHRNYFNSIFLQ